MGAGLELTATKESYSLKKDCLMQLQFNKEFLLDLRKLPINISEPHLERSWMAYDVFIKKFGSHYKTGVLIGKQISNFVFVKQIPDYNEYYLGAAACAKVRLASLSECERYSESDYQHIKLVDFSNNFRVLGGTAAERQNFMLNSPNTTMVVEFLKSNSSNEVLGYTMEPIWELLIYKFVGSKEFIIAINMLQYFNGFLAKDCRYKEVNTVPVKRFVKVSDESGVPEYECQVADTGCRDDSDCQLLASSFWSHCYCGGSTCIVDDSYTSAELGKIPDRKARIVPVGSTYEGENLSCNYNIGPYCSCDKVSLDTWVKAWPTVDTDITRDLSMYRALMQDILQSDAMTITWSYVCAISLFLLF